MISDRDTNTIYFSEKLSDIFPTTSKLLNEALDNLNIIPKTLSKTKDIWARDYMPIQVSDTKFIEYRYDPDYLQGIGFERREVKTYPDIVSDSINLKTIKTDLILDGGNVVKSSNSIILTDKILMENKRTYTKTQILEILHSLFDVEKIALIPWDREEEYGHADGMVRFINYDTILVNNDYASDKELLNQLRLNSYNCEFLKYEVNEPDDNNWAYLNFLQTKDLILIPKLHIVEDEQAFEQICNFYPNYAVMNRIIQIDMTEIVPHGGALNCISWTTKE